MKILTAAMLLLLAGCGQGGSGKAQIDFMWFSDGGEGEVMKDIIEEYEKQHPEVDINLVEVAFKDVKTKLKTMIAGGKPPAMVRINDTYEFADYAIDLTDYVGDQDKFTSQFEDSIKPFYVINDRIIAAPMDITANGMYYNKDLFKKAGVEVPQSPDEIWTWGEFREALSKIKDSGEARYPMVWDFSGHRWSTMMYEYGGQLFSEDLKKAEVNSPEAVKALKEFKAMHEEGLMPDSVWLGGENPNNLFRSGTVAVHLAGNWMMGSYKDITHFDWGVTYLPQEDRRSSVPGGKYVMGMKGTGVEKETAEFIKYLSTKEVNAEYIERSLFLSARKDNKNLSYPLDDKMFEVFTDEFKNTAPEAARDWSYQQVISKNAGDLTTGISKALKGESTPQEALDEVAKIFNETIAQNSEKP
ncbi:extracellular solute-binding protein [Bacillus mangrovi]|uniref:Extracellular solute-binding protein n=2 Tax=Metabacillus mangrovi TaxID=1491830 RepID=A0A7X2V397_9BACI|nr:extracellular solute-binding protein [Metabacillus mangrovi]